MDSEKIGAREGTCLDRKQGSAVTPGYAAQPWTWAITCNSFIVPCVSPCWLAQAPCIHEPRTRPVTYAAKFKYLISTSLISTYTAKRASQGIFLTHVLVFSPLARREMTRQKTHQPPLSSARTSASSLTCCLPVPSRQSSLIRPVLLSCKAAEMVRCDNQTGPWLLSGHTTHPLPRPGRFWGSLCLPPTMPVCRLHQELEGERSCHYRESCFPATGRAMRKRVLRREERTVTCGLSGCSDDLPLRLKVAKEAKRVRRRGVALSTGEVHNKREEMAWMFNQLKH